jgi:hypothetical protein
VICHSDCPIVCCSKLQHEIASSTIEAEYNALSIVMCELSPFKHLVVMVSSIVGLEIDDPTAFKRMIWEGNNGELTLPNMEAGRMTPQSKVCFTQ